MGENPYMASMAPVSARSESSKASDHSVFDMARKVFLAWEKLRVLYIAIIGITTILLVYPGYKNPRVIMLVIEGAVISNLLYFAGPVTETYVRWLGYRGQVLRWVLFLCGTLVTLVLAFFSLVNVLLPNQN